MTKQKISQGNMNPHLIVGVFYFFFGKLKYCHYLCGMNNQIEEKLVSFEVAQLLNQKKFNCITNKITTLFSSESLIDNLVPIKNSDDRGYISVPTQQIALDWLEVNFGIEILPMRNMTGGYTAHIYTGHKSINEGKDFSDITIITGNSAKNATDSALRHVLTTLISVDNK